MSDKIIENTNFTQEGNTIVPNSSLEKEYNNTEETIIIEEDEMETRTIEQAKIYSLILSPIFSTDSELIAAMSFSLDKLDNLLKDNRVEPYHKNNKRLVFKEGSILEYFHGFRYKNEDIITYTWVDEKNLDSIKKQNEKIWI